MTSTPILACLRRYPSGRTWKQLRAALCADFEDLDIGIASALREGGTPARADTTSFDARQSSARCQHDRSKVRFGAPHNHMNLIESYSYGLTYEWLCEGTAQQSGPVGVRVVPGAVQRRVQGPGVRQVIDSLIAVA